MILLVSLIYVREAQIQQTVQRTKTLLHSLVVNGFTLFICALLCVKYEIFVYMNTLTTWPFLTGPALSVCITYNSTKQVVLPRFARQGFDTNISLIYTLEHFL